MSSQESETTPRVFYVWSLKDDGSRMNCGRRIAYGTEDNVRRQFPEGYYDVELVPEDDDDTVVTVTDETAARAQQDYYNSR
jgi:hypothetical protein